MRDLQYFKIFQAHRQNPRDYIAAAAALTPDFGSKS
jgi:hypothetical protein